MTNRRSIIIACAVTGVAALFLGFAAANVTGALPPDFARIVGAVLLASVAMYINDRTARRDVG